MANGLKEYRNGEKMIVELSRCCQGKMIAVSYGNFLACKSCKESDREWGEYIAEFWTGWPLKNADGTVTKMNGPVTDSRFIVPVEEYKGEISGLVHWG